MPRLRSLRRLPNLIISAESRILEGWILADVGVKHATTSGSAAVLLSLVFSPHPSHAPACFHPIAMLEAANLSLRRLATWLLFLMGALDSQRIQSSLFRADVSTYPMRLCGFERLKRRPNNFS